MDNAQTSGIAPLNFSKPWWKTLVSYLMLGLLLLLNVSLVMSTAKEYAVGHLPDALTLATSYLAVIFFDITILLPLVLEVQSIDCYPDKVLVKTLLWRAEIAWAEIVSLRMPVYLKFAILRTKGIFYLLNKRDLKPFDMLVGEFTSRLHGN